MASLSTLLAALQIFLWLTRLYRHFNEVSNTRKSMSAIALALAPLFIILMTGMLLNKSGFLPEAFWRGLEKFTYWALLPALFLRTMATAEFAGLELGSAILAVISLLILMMILVVLTRPLCKSWDGASYSSLIQGCTRFNNYVGLPVVLSLFGHDGLVVYAVLMAVMIPLTNITSVWGLCHYASHEPMRWGRLSKLIVTNPLIVSTLIGILLSLSGIGLPPVIKEVVDAFADASLLTGLLAIGASLSLAAAKLDKHRVLYTCFLKLVIFPAIAAGCALFFGLDNVSASVLILFAALPTATSSFILASQMGGNSTLMANIVATETLLAFATMPVVLLLVMHYFPV